MTAEQLISLYHQAWTERMAIFGIPGGYLSPEEAAGRLVEEYGLSTARHLACVRAENSPAAWSHEMQVWQTLQNVFEG